jgi:hypothetical protein
MLRIEQGDAKYSFAVDWYLPSENNAVCMLYQSQGPDAFFGSVQSFLNANPTINLAMFSWCGEAYWYDPNTYIAQMEALEAANPKVKFIYMTGHAQEDGCSGCLRHIFNQKVRAYCKTNNKILFDFADLDSWYGGAESTYLLDGDCGCAGMNIQLQHPQYYAQEAYHTTYESCMNKGRAVWWMLAKLAGWGQATPVESGGLGGSAKNNGLTLYQNYPNPFNEMTEITLELPQEGWSEAKICNLLGREVRLLQRGIMAAGQNVLRWDGRDNGGCQVADGIFLLVYTDGRQTAVRRLVVLR